MLKLEVKKREKEDLTELRDGGQIPAVFYGPKQESTSITVSEKDFMKAWKEAGESTVIILNLDGEEHEALIHEVEEDAVKDTVIHIDFYVIEKGKKVEVEVPIIFEGTSPAEKTLGGVLVKVMHELEIEAMPKDLPHEIVVNVESLVDFDSQIHAKDIKLPEGVTLLTEPEEVVALVQEPKEESEEPTTIDMDSIEVAGEKKEEKEGEEASTEGDK